MYTYYPDKAREARNAIRMEGYVFNRYPWRRKELLLWLFFPQNLFYFQVRALYMTLGIPVQLQLFPRRFPEK